MPIAVRNTAVRCRAGRDRTQRSATIDFAIRLGLASIIVKAERDPAKGNTARQPEPDTDCKKYFPQIGQTISVPCEKKR